MDKNIDTIKEDIQRNYSTLPTAYFAKKYNKSLGRIYTIACLLGVTRTAKIVEDEMNMVGDYKGGMSLENIAKKYKHNPATIRNFLVKNKIDVRVNDGSWQKLYDWDTTYFKHIDSHEKAYWLGFIYADGNIYTKGDEQGVFQICLAFKDREHIEKLKACLKSTHKTYNDRGNCRFMISQQEIYDDLRKLGVTKNKSLTLVRPTQNQVPEKFISSFLLGYFDGDGWITMNVNKKCYEVGIISTLQFCKFFKKYLKRHGILKGRFYKEKRRGGKKNVWYLKYGGGFATEAGKENLIKIFNFLYSNSQIFLSRKKERFLYCIDSPRDYTKKVGRPTGSKNKKI